MWFDYAKEIEEYNEKVQAFRKATGKTPELPDIPTAKNPGIDVVYSGFPGAGEATDCQRGHRLSRFVNTVYH